MGRAAAVLVLGAALAAYYTFHDRLWGASTWWNIAFLSFVLIPACFALVWLVLPLRLGRGLLAVGLAFGVLAWACHVADWTGAESFAKLFGVTALGFWFLSYFETLGWVVLIALIIPAVDALSVFHERGPTHQITKEHPEIFTDIFSFTFPVPGIDSAAYLGLPDLLFFALFLAAAARFALRPGLTWILMTLSFGGTLALTVLRENGMPALPLLSVGFLLANADLIWARLRPGARARS